MKVYFMRHGESEYNPERRINQNPKIKIHLTEKGKMQARKVGRKLSRVNFNIIFVSDFLRTQETAKIINGKRKIKIIVDKRINEIKTGFESLSVDVYNLYTKKDWLKFKLKGKESYLDVKARLGNFIEYLKTKRYENVLIITHESVLQCAFMILGKMADIKGRKKKVKNCEYFVFEI